MTILLQQSYWFVKFISISPSLLELHNVETLKFEMILKENDDIHDILSAVNRTDEEKLLWISNV